MFAAPTEVAVQNETQTGGVQVSSLDHLHQNYLTIFFEMQILGLHSEQQNL